MSEQIQGEQPLPVSDLLGNDGPLPEVHWKGDVYRVGIPCPEVIAHAERAVPQLALANVREAWAGTPELAREEEAVRAAIRGKQFGFGQPLFMSVVGGADGNRLILWACMRLFRPDVTLADVRAMLRDEAASVELEAALEVVAPAFFRAAADLSDQPPALRRAMAEEMSAAALAAVLEQKLRRLQLLTRPGSSESPTHSETTLS